MTTKLRIVARVVVKVAGLEPSCGTRLSVKYFSSVIDPLEDEATGNSLLGEGNQLGASVSRALTTHLGVVVRFFDLGLIVAVVDTDKHGVTGSEDDIL